jgi:hypothetical protein
VAICSSVNAKVEVEIEVAAVRRHVGELPPHAALVRGELLDRRAGDRHQRDVACVQVRERAVEPVGEPGAAGTGLLVRRAEHELVDQELPPAVEQLGQRRLPVLGVEAVLFLDEDPRQLLPLFR